jgi:hypothetical protein
MTVSEQKHREIPIDYWDSANGTFVFQCRCGRQEIGPWEESRWLMVRHIEESHADAKVKLDLDRLEDLIEFLVSPSPLNSWEQLQSDSQV